MEQIEKELSEKTIEKQVEFVVDNVIDPPKEVEVKPKKPRSQAQKEAFEKARKKRAENLKKKKEEEHLDYEEVNEEESDRSIVPPKVVKKPRGRPKGVKNKKVMKREPEPSPDNPNYPHPVDYAIHPAQDHGFRYQGHQYQSPYPPMAYQPPPQVHNYYYGHQQGAVHQAPTHDPMNPRRDATAPTNYEPEPEPEPEYESDPSSDDEMNYLPPPTPELKYRFA